MVRVKVITFDITVLLIPGNFPNLVGGWSLILQRFTSSRRKIINATVRPRRYGKMVSIANVKNKKELGRIYNFQHIVLVSKYWFKVFKNPETQRIIADAFREVEMRFDIKIKEFAFGDDYAHIHMEVNVPRNLQMRQAEHILKSYSVSKVFNEIC